MIETTVAGVMAELAALEDPKVHEVNRKHRDDQGVNLGKLREFAKRLKTQQDLARRLWETDDAAASFLATLGPAPGGSPIRIRWSRAPDGR